MGSDVTSARTETVAVSAPASGLGWQGGGGCSAHVAEAKSSSADRATRFRRLGIGSSGVGLHVRATTPMARRRYAPKVSCAPSQRPVELFCSDGVYTAEGAGLEDEQLMLEYAAGDLRAFELLFERWAPRLHAFFRRSLGSAVDADDLLQATFLRVHRARRSFRSGLPLRGWLFTVAARLRIDELRRRHRLANAEEALSWVDEEAQVSSDKQREVERALLVQAALARLAESQRMVIHLH